MDEKQCNDIILRLERIKGFIFRNTIAKVDYNNIERKTGCQMPFYREIVELNDIINELKYLNKGEK